MTHSDGSTSRAPGISRYFLVPTVEYTGVLNWRTLHSSAAGLDIITDYPSTSPSVRHEVFRDHAFNGLHGDRRRPAVTGCGSHCSIVMASRHLLGSPQPIPRCARDSPVRRSNGPAVCRDARTGPNSVSPAVAAGLNALDFFRDNTSDASPRRTLFQLVPWQSRRCWGIRILGPVAQQVVGQDAGHHRLAHRHGPDADAGIVAALGDDLDIVA
jgi:hypothetical protein